MAFDGSVWCRLCNPVLYGSGSCLLWQILDVSGQYRIIVAAVG